MNLDAQYELSYALTASGTTRSFRALESQGGKEVMLHLLEGDWAAIERQMRALPAAKRDLILAMGVHSGAPCVVTEVLPHSITFDEWLKPGTLFHRGRWITGPAESAPTQQLPQMSTNAGAEPSELTKMLSSAGSSLPTQALPQMRPPGDSTATQVLPNIGPTSSEPTQMLPRTGVPIAEPGEMTKMLNPTGSLPTQALPRVSAPAAGTEPGEFTRMFDQAAPAPPAPVKTKPIPPVAQVPVQAKPVERRQRPQTSSPLPKVAPSAPPQQTSKAGSNHPVQLKPAVPPAANYLPLIYAMAGAIAALLVIVLYLIKR
jgi:hypothetical protein